MDKYIKKQEIIWYPWLSNPYRQIISGYLNNKKNYSMLINTKIGLGTDILIKKISQRLFCMNPNNLKSCFSCHACQLILKSNHPDFYKIQCGKYINKIDINNLRNIISHLYYSSYQNRKIIWIKNIEFLTIESMTLLLKVLEEPKKNIIFLLSTHNKNKILKTIQSRCICISIDSPKKETLILWLKKYTSQLSNNELEIISNLHINNPKLAFNLIHIENWIKRKKFFYLLRNSLINKNLLLWLSEFNQNNISIKLYWLITILIDVLKNKMKIENFIINTDQLDLINQLNLLHSNDMLFEIIKEWNIYYFRLKSKININKKIQLVSQLINWQEKIFN
ncbi:MAG: DNA polymerase III subunit delta' C-terminal domain-containing protein [Arsenophonus sp.]|nr:MAG: DNA polymerase III subunit delta' C-terminal domain-containing protein [Arsenophonus sp.]